MPYKDPLRALLKKQPNKRFTENWFAVMFKHSEGWTISSIEKHKDTAVSDMEKQKKLCPEYKYKVVPCQIWIAWHNINSPGF